MASRPGYTNSVIFLRRPCRKPSATNSVARCLSPDIAAICASSHGPSFPPFPHASGVAAATQHHQPLRLQVGVAERLPRHGLEYVHGSAGMRAVPDDVRDFACTRRIVRRRERFGGRRAHAIAPGSDRLGACRRRLEFRRRAPPCPRSRCRFRPRDALDCDLRASPNSTPYRQRAVLRSCPTIGRPPVRCRHSRRW